MATDRPRKNLFLTDELADGLRKAAFRNNISESEVGRRALELYLNILDTPPFDAAAKLAYEKRVPIHALFLQMMDKIIPDKYYKD